MTIQAILQFVTKITYSKPHRRAHCGQMQWWEESKEQHRSSSFPALGDNNESNNEKEFSLKTWKKFWGKEWPNDDHGEEAKSQEDINDAEPKTMLSQVGSSAELGLVLMLNKPWVNNLVGAV